MTPDTYNQEGLWVSISELAKRKGLRKQTVAEKVSRFEAQGILTTQPGGRGRPKLVNLAEFDRVSGEAGDAIREMNATGGAPSAPSEPASGGNPVLAREQARRVAYQADLAKLDLDERLGKLVPIDDVEKAMVRCAEALVRAIDRLPGRAEELASRVAQEGAQGARAILKETARELRATLAREMRLLASEQEPEEPDEPKTDEV